MTEVTSEPRAYVRHVRGEKLCSAGGREFFRRYDLDWNDFLTNGIPVSELEKTGDYFALKVAARARAEQNG